MKKEQYENHKKTFLEIRDLFLQNHENFALAKAFHKPMKFYGEHVRPFCRSWWVVAGSIPAGRLLIFDNIILLCRRLCAMLLMYSLINCTVIFNCLNCLYDSMQLYCLWWLINCACLLPFSGGGSRPVYIAVA